MNYLKNKLCAIFWFFKFSALVRISYKKCGLVVIGYVIALLIFGLLSFTSTVFALEIDNKEVLDLIKSSPSKKEGPPGAILILLDEEEHTLNKDGSVIMRLHRVIKIIDKNGVAGFGDVEHTYNASHQTCKIKFARTILPNGEIIPVDIKDIQEKSLYSNYKAYSDIREIKFFMPAIQDDSVIEYEIITVDKSPNIKDNLWFDFEFYEGYMTYHTRLIVNIPKNKYYKYKWENKYIYQQGRELLNSEINPKIKISDGMKTLTWHIDNIFLTWSFEKNKGPYSSRCPYFIFSTIPKWKDVVCWYGELTSMAKKGSPDIKNAVEQITVEVKDKNEIINKVYRYICKEIRYVSIDSFDIYDYKPHMANDIFRNKYGDCKDKTTLLIAMLGEAGIPGYYGLVRTSSEGQIIRNIPAVQFNHAVAIVPKENGEYLILDPTVSFYRVGEIPSEDRNTEILIIKENTARFYRVPTEHWSKNQFVGNIELEILHNQSIKGKVQIITTGQYDKGMRYLFDKMNSVKKELFFKKMVFSISPKAILRNYNCSDVEDLSGNFTCKFEFEANDFLNKSGDMLIMPPISLLGIDTSYLQTDDRLYNMRFVFMGENVSKIKIIFPKDYSLLSIPDNYVCEEKGFWFKRDIVRNKNELIINDIYRTTSLNVSSIYFRKNKEALENILGMLKECIVFKAKS